MEKVRPHPRTENSVVYEFVYSTKIKKKKKEKNIEFVAYEEKTKRVMTFSLTLSKKTYMVIEFCTDRL